MTVAPTMPIAEVQGSRVAEHPRARQRTLEHLAEFGTREQQLYREAGEDQCQQRATTEGSPRQLATSDQDQTSSASPNAESNGAPGQRQVEQQLQGDGGADHLGQVAAMIAVSVASHSRRHARRVAFAVQVH